jgi:hypothetical protein
MWQAFIGQHDCPGCIDCAGVHLGSCSRCTAGRRHVLDERSYLACGQRRTFRVTRLLLRPAEQHKHLARPPRQLEHNHCGTRCETKVEYLHCCASLADTIRPLGTCFLQHMDKKNHHEASSSPEGRPCCSGVVPPAGPPAKQHALWIKAMVPHIVILSTLVPMTGLLLTRIWYLQVCPYPLGYGVIGMPVLT